MKITIKAGKKDEMRDLAMSGVRTKLLHHALSLPDAKVIIEPAAGTAVEVQVYDSVEHMTETLTKVVQNINYIKSLKKKS
jgi:predicted transcriptional regulator